MRSIRAPNKGSAPEKEVTRKGHEFSPYWQPVHGCAELGYCQQLSEWWGSSNALQAPGSSSMPRRRHLLLSEASPDIAPGGFFNCTVEVSTAWSLSGSLTPRCKVLQKSESPDGPTTVYVTDYTANPLTLGTRDNGSLNPFPWDVQPLTSQTLGTLGNTRPMPPRRARPLAHRHAKQRTNRPANTRPDELCRTLLGRPAY